MSALKNIPRLRFPEFDGNWSVIDIKDVFSILNGYAFSSLDSQEKGVKWVKIADVGVGKMVHENVSYLRESYLSKHKKFILKKGDFVVALTRPILSGKLKISPIDDYYHNSLLNQRVGKIETKNESVFIYNLLRTNRLINTIENNINGSEPPNLSPSTLNGIKVDIPFLPEQQKIAEFLSSVDKKIQLLEKKKEQLELYKKGVMQKIFSREIRFKDENGNSYPDWESKTLDQLFEFKRGKSVVENKFGNYFLLEMGSVSIEGKLIAAKRTSRESFLLKNDLIMPERDIGKGYIIGRSAIINEDNKYVLGGNLLSLTAIQNLCSHFINYQINEYSFRKKLKRIVNGSAQLMITSREVKKLSLNLPIFDEQKKIADFLFAIDKKIETTSTQIDKTKEFKKGLLQQMFV